jgi:NodT family efflux transporter outer membrane factor (OMF) lipoprotein
VWFRTSALAESHFGPVRPSISRLGPVFAASLLLAGCAVGPDFHSPAAPSTTGYTESPLPGETVAAASAQGGSQKFAPERDVPADWWTLFRSPPLDDLVRRALADSPTLEAARAAVRQAEENYNASLGGALYPNVTGSLSAKRQRLAGASTGFRGAQDNVYNLYNASVAVSYSLDFFGGARRALEGLAAQIDYQHFELEAATMTLAANVVTTAVQEASLRGRIQANEEILAAQEKQLDVARERFRLGAVSRSDVLLQQGQVAQTRASLPPLQRQLDQTRHALAALSGRLPNEGGVPAFDLDGFTLPEEIPVSLPSALVRQRPDLRAAEALLHQASAQVGVATAAQFPQISLSAGYGSSASEVSNLFGSTGLGWNLGAALLQPIFNGGQLSAKRRQAEAAYDQAAAQYRQTVLQAFQNVADSLRALETDAQALAASADAEAAARNARDLTEKQFKLGAASYLSLLTAEQQYQQSRVNLVQARATRLADTAALYQALGGGWWNRKPSEISSAADQSAPKETHE